MTPCAIPADDAERAAPGRFKEMAIAAAGPSVRTALLWAPFMLLSAAIFFFWSQSAFAKGEPLHAAATALIAFACLALGTLLLAASLSAVFAVRVRDIALMPETFGPLCRDLQSFPQIKAYMLDASGPLAFLAGPMLSSCFMAQDRGGTALVATRNQNPERAGELEKLCSEFGWSPRLAVQYIALHEFAHALRNLKCGPDAYCLDANIEESAADAFALMRLFGPEAIRAPAMQLAQARSIRKGGSHDTSKTLLALSDPEISWTAADGPLSLLAKAEDIAAQALGRPMPAEGASCPARCLEC